MTTSCSIRDLVTRADVEQNVQAFFLKVEDLLIAHGARQNDVDDDLDEVVKQDPVKAEPLKLENRAF
ncbi:hypothetical protein BGZ47_002595 [Haplosporangium gracile]|nr:hypothetical protein BGZ47_002595 [Haplosporangium gracile]